MDLLIDMNLTPRWVPFLAEAGHHAFHWSSTGRPTATDDEIFEYARKNKFAVLTNDLDFSHILAHTGTPHPA